MVDARIIRRHIPFRRKHGDGQWTIHRGTLPEGSFTVRGLENGIDLGNTAFYDIAILEDGIIVQGKIVVQGIGVQQKTGNEQASRQYPFKTGKDRSPPLGRNRLILLRLFFVGFSFCHALIYGITYRTR